VIRAPRGAGTCGDESEGRALREAVRQRLGRVTKEERMNIRNNRTTLAAVALVGAGLVGASANADFYQFTFGGNVDWLEGQVPAPWSEVGIGSVFEVSYIFDSEAEDHHGSQHIGFYYLISAEILIDGESQATSVGDILVSVDEQLYDVHFHDLPIQASASVELYAYWDTFETDELPLTLDLDDFPSRWFEACGYEWQIAGVIDGFSGEIVPAPASLLVLSGGLVLRHRRNRGRS
jgi:hypothetical protein